VWVNTEEFLNVKYVNRDRDLIYYNERYNSFILVQYKLLKEESRKFVYRPDKQMEEELLRMNSFMSEYKNNESIKTTEEYRLNDDGFLFKFVENKGIKITSSELISGLYITREYMNFIKSDNAPKGKRGATIISTKTTPRYLTNSEFTMLVNNGFLGTRELHSDVLKELIKEYFLTGKAVLLAIETNLKEISLNEY